MKLICTVSVSNRLLPALSIKAKIKSAKSTLALCKHPNSEKYYMILFTGQDKTGVKYDLLQNIEKVLTKFVNDGKTTIQFRNPPHDLFVQAEVIPLKGFLHLLQRILKGTISPKELTCSSLGVTRVAPKNIAPTKLVIQSRGDYPSKGFPRTLESLTITKINRSGLDLGILRLSKLKILNLSENCIAKLPEEFSQMVSLQVLDVSSNELFKSLRKDWGWLSGNLSRTLTSLNLSNNQLVYVPEHIIKLKNLCTLNLSRNKLTELPSGVGRLSNLRDFNISTNTIVKLPGSINKLRLKSFDISNNVLRNIPQDPLNDPDNTLLKVSTLKEYAAKRVLDLKLYYNSAIIPATLVSFLDVQAKFCICGKACFSVFSNRNITLNLSVIAENVITSGNEYNSSNVLVDCYFCSHGCTKFYQKHRAPLIR